MERTSRPRRDVLAEQARAIDGLREGPLTAEALTTLRRALADRSALVVARAAGVVRERAIRELAPELGAAFARFLDDAVKRDAGCTAKLALVRALAAVETGDPAVFLLGVRHVQMEPVWGGQVDTAGALRGTSLQGLVAMGHREALFAAVPLLVDPRLEARRLAVEALGQIDADASELLLRLKVLAGDDEAAVLGDAFGALLAVNPSRSLPFVAAYLRRDDADLAEMAALAIADSRHPEAFAALVAPWRETRDEVLRERLLLPLALTRTEEAFELLLELVPAARLREAEAAVRALRIFRSDDARRARIEAALGERDEPRAWAAFEE